MCLKLCHQSFVVLQNFYHSVNHIVQILLKNVHFPLSDVNIYFIFYSELHLHYSNNSSKFRYAPGKHNIKYLLLAYTSKSSSKTRKYLNFSPPTLFLLRADCKTNHKRSTSRYPATVPR